MILRFLQMIFFECMWMWDESFYTKLLRNYIARRVTDCPKLAQASDELLVSTNLICRRSQLASSV